MNRARRRNQKKYKRRKKQRALAALAVRQLANLHERPNYAGEFHISIDGSAFTIPLNDIYATTAKALQSAFDAVAPGKIKVG